MPTSPRVPPVAEQDRTDEQKRLLGPWGKMNFAAVMVNHPALYRVFMPVIAKVIAETDLPPRDRQILVHRTLALSDEIYEARHHELISQGAGLSEADIEAARTDGPSLTPFEHLLVKAADQLVQTRRIDDAIWAALSQHYSRVQMMELVAVVGVYNMMSMLTLGFEIELEDAETFQSFTRQRDYE
jgi:4-carboxymuconolactone decarboxylase